MPDPLHITHVVLSLDTGGLERIVVDLVREGHRRGQRVSVVCLERPGNLAVQAEALGARVFCIGKKPGLQLRVRHKIQAVLRSLRPDVLHTHQIGALFYAGSVARSAGVRVVVHTEHIDNFRKAAAGFYRRQRMDWLWWWAARYALKFFCVSEDIAVQMISRRIVPQDKLEVVLNGINIELFRKPIDRLEFRRLLEIPTDAFVIGTVGRLDEVKSQDLLLRAFARVRANHPSARLLIVGDGPNRQSLQQLALQLGVAGVTQFTGYQLHPDQYLHAMDAFALPSRMEGLPLVILEAWAAGLSVVASAVGGVPGLIEHGRTGLLFPSGDEARLAQFLQELAHYPLRAEALGRAGRSEVMARYDLRRMADDYERFYRQLLSGKEELLACVS